MSDEVPVLSSTQQAFADPRRAAAAALRHERLRAEFKKLYGEEPSLVARAPGRVNLIGEHIDYEGYAVLPMAVELDTLVAIRKASPTDATSSSPSSAVLRVANVLAEKYPPHEFLADPAQELDRSSHLWANYFLCAYKGVYDQIKVDRLEAGPLVGFDVLVDGVVPTGSGLSSSSAFVVSSSVALMAALGLSFPRATLADFTCRCEQYIGMQSGGMDQAISIMARPGLAQLINFNPVTAADVALPPGGTFVVAHSLAVADKAVTAHTNYNRRVVECTLAAILLAVRTGSLSPPSACATIKTLSDVEPLCAATSSAEGAKGDEWPPITAVKSLLHDEPYSRDEIESTLATDLSSLFSRSPASLAVLAAADTFKLKQRALHVFSEALRVRRFKEAADSFATQDSSSSPSPVLSQLGALMNDSHASCSVLYECSCPELEELVGICRSHGALGSRLTGAGWGGCTVSLVREEAVDGFIAAVKAEFYAPRVRSGLVTEEQLDSFIFASKPGGGAAIFSA